MIQGSPVSRSGFLWDVPRPPLIAVIKPATQGPSAPDLGIRRDLRVGTQGWGCRAGSCVGLVSAPSILSHGAEVSRSGGSGPRRGLCCLPCGAIPEAGPRCRALSLGWGQPSCREEQVSPPASRIRPVSVRLRPPSSFLHATLRGLVQMTQTLPRSRAGPARDRPGPGGEGRPPIRRKRGLGI